MQITHFRVLNELRRRSRQPRLAPDPEYLLMAEIADEGAPPADRMADDERRSAARATLPETQREALRLAILEDRTHEQVAGELELPLGTAKTRIRAGMQKLRSALVAHAAMLALVAIVTVLGVRYRALRDDLARSERALTVVTASDMENVRLAPEPGFPEATHARYRRRAGIPIAVVTLSSFPPLPAGSTYQAWARCAGEWVSLGTAAPDAEGNARLVAERAALSAPTDAVEITIEPSGGHAAPSGPVVVSWQRPTTSD